jgi:hypothetical protein
VALGRALDRAQHEAAEPATLVMLPSRREDTPTPAGRENAARVPDPPPRDRTPAARVPGPPPGHRTAATRGPIPPPRAWRRGPATLAALALVAAAVAAGWLATHAGGDNGAERQRAADASVVRRLIDNYARALDSGDEKLLARTVSPDVVRTGTDGTKPDCVTDTGSPAALARWAAQLDEIKTYVLTGTAVRVDGTGARVTAQSAINGQKPATTRFEAQLEGGVWRLTRVEAPCRR